MFLSYWIIQETVNDDAIKSLIEQRQQQYDNDN